jgi:hypothetical protein
MKNIKILLTLLISFSFPTLANTNTNTDWIFCMVTDDLNNSVYFTDVFHGNYDQLEAYQLHFRAHVIKKYSQEPNESTYCGFENEKGETLAEYNSELTDSKSIYENVVVTSWKK